MEGEEEEEAPGSFSVFSFCPAHTTRERGGATLLPASATYSMCLPFPFPASLHLKTKLPLRLEIN